MKPKVKDLPTNKDLNRQRLFQKFQLLRQKMSLYSRLYKSNLGIEKFQKL